ncbi:SpoIVB peptidase [Clostridium sp. AN503]|uniref:SpoIVB peptidase n=1 Tax=Clostridium sp. AN503 TaxID=3160598 RepID=UPI003457AD6F
MTGRRKFRRCLIWTFWAGVLFTLGFTWFYMERRIPDHLNIVAQEREELDLELPFDVTLFSESEEVVLGNESDIPSNQIRLKTDESLSLYAKNQGSYRIGLNLFGKIRFKEIQVDVVDSQYAIPCGLPVGIYLKSKGVMVIGTGQIVGEDGQEVEPAYGVLQTGDYIEAINGQPLRDKEALITNLNHLEGSETLLRIRRQGEEMDVRMNAVKTEDGSYKLGAWVRDDTQGIGTMTYIDMSGNFGALGHGISDSDTGKVVEIEEGALYETEILGIEKGTIGNPGVMAGVIYYGPGSQLGTITDNTDIGIFGKVNDKMKKSLQAQAVEVGYRQDVKKGQAWVRSDVSGELKDYEIEIQKVDYNPVQQNKSMVIKVVDEELLRLTGGIVQGMSGSPILQDGKLIGAVTHVFVQDSTRGYGIFVEDMLKH